MDKVRNFKFGVWIDRRVYKPKNSKVGQKGRGLRHVTYFLNFGTPSIFLEWVQLETSNLVCGFAAWPINQKNAKVSQKGRGLRHVTYFYNFGTPFISLERTKLETSNLVCGLIVGSTNQKKSKVGQKGRCLRHVTYFLNFGTPPYFWNGCS